MLVNNPENLSHSLGKDLKKVFKKYFYVFTKSCYMTSADDLVKWDFLGPFFISILFSLYDVCMSQININRSVYWPRRKENINEYNNGFVLFFLLLWIGPVFIGINASYFGCYVHWLSVVSVTMYLMLPMCIGSVFSLMVPFMFRAVFMLPSFLYSCLILYRFLKNQATDNNYFLCFQPVFIFYSIFAMLSVLN